MERKESERYEKWLRSVSKLFSGQSYQPMYITPRKAIYEPYLTKVVIFPKTLYDKNTLESLTDQEKYGLALNDTTGECRVYGTDEYTNMLNEHTPLDRYVWTYIVKISENVKK